MDKYKKLVEKLRREKKELSILLIQREEDEEEEQEKPLTLIQYKERYGTSFRTIAKRAGLSFSQVYNIKRGVSPTLRTAMSIEKYTRGEVTCQSLLPPEVQKEINLLKDCHEFK